MATIDGVLYSKPDKRLIFYPQMRGKDYNDDELFLIGLLNGNVSMDTITSFVIPSGIKRIDENAFCCADELTSIEIPASVEFIARDSFSDISEKVVFKVERNSYAAIYCKDHGFNYTYPDADAWLLN